MTPPDFVNIGGVVLPIPKIGGIDEAPDGMGKRRWTVTTASVDASVVAALEAVIGVPSGAESERAWDGTLWTTLPFVDVSGDAFAASGVTSCEVRITSAPYRPPLVRSTASHSRRIALTLREA